MWHSPAPFLCTLAPPTLPSIITADSADLLSDPETESDYTPPSPLHSASSYTLPLSSSQQKRVEQCCRIGLVATRKCSNSILTEEDKRELAAIKASLGMLPGCAEQGRYSHERASDCHQQWQVKETARNRSTQPEMGRTEHPELERLIEGKTRLKCTPNTEHAPRFGKSQRFPVNMAQSDRCVPTCFQHYEPLAAGQQRHSSTQQTMSVGHKWATERQVSDNHINGSQLHGQRPKKSLCELPEKSLHKCELHWNLQPILPQLASLKVVHSPHAQCTE